MELYWAIGGAAVVVVLVGIAVIVRRRMRARAGKRPRDDIYPMW